MVRVDAADSNLDNPASYREVDLLEAITREAQKTGLDAELQPAIGVMRPDLVVRRAQLPLLVVEVKRELGTIHFAGISQVTAYGKTLEALLGSAVYPVLISTGESTDELASLARTLGVHLISVHGLDLELAAERSIGLLTELAESKEGEVAVAPSEAHEFSAAVAQLRNRLAHGESQSQISDELNVDPSELRDLYMTLLTKLEATEPDRLDGIMRAWERVD
jgi:hypothetical protein